jgi:hypothetical protein
MRGGPGSPTVGASRSASCSSPPAQPPGDADHWSRVDKDAFTHYACKTLRNVRSSERLRMQGAYSGPAQPWSDGFAVSKLKRCDPR